MDQFLKELGDVAAPKEEREDVIHPYERLEKAAVLQDARIFHDSILVRESPRKCCVILSKILYLQNDPKSSSSKLTHDEATELFFAATKLFVDAEDASLRRMVYLFIKEMRPLCDPSDVIIVTSCLTKDMTCDVNLYRANAIRVLVDIIDSAMLGSIERYIKQAIVDDDLQVSNAAIVSASHLFEQSSDNATIVRRWVNEVQEMLVKQSGRRSAANYMVQANALRLLCQMKGHDRLGMAKLLQKFSGMAGSGIRSPLAIVILIRLCGKLLQEEMSMGHASVAEAKNMSPLCKLGFDFLDSSLSHPDQMICYEAARTYCALPVETHNLSKAMECFRVMLLSDRPVDRFAAVQVLSKVTDHSRAVALCNEGLEHCVGDDNKQTATLAIRTLLKTGSESTVDRMLGKVSGLINDMQDEYKIEMLKSLEDLCLKYPTKHQSIVAFLASVLREEGGFEFKLGVVDTIISLMEQMPETTESSLFHLCECIEDCEYTHIIVHCLGVIAELGPKTSAPSRYVRFIWNRVILENSTIRAAAVSALAAFASHCPSLRSSIIALLRYASYDEDNETRDRASLAVSVLNEAMMQNPYVAPSADEEYDEFVPDEPSDGDVAAFVYLQKLPMTFKNLEQSIKAYMSIPTAMENTEHLTLSTLPVIEDANDFDIPTVDQNMLVNGSDQAAATVQAKDPAAAVYEIPELADLGRVFRSSPPIPLTEEETEYVVRCIKHIMPEHIILQFIILNTVDDMRIENILVDLECDSDAYHIIGDVPAEKADYGVRAHAFAVLQRHADGMEPARFTCQLNFTAIQVDPDSKEPLVEGYSEEYPLEDLAITPSDYMAKAAIPDFRHAWNSSDDSHESLGKFAMQHKSLADALSAAIELLGMAPCDGTGQLSNISADKKQHMLHLSGRYLGGHEVLARAQLSLRPGDQSGVLLKIAVRSDDKSVSDAVISCIS